MRHGSIGDRIYTTLIYLVGGGSALYFGAHFLSYLVHG